MYAMPANVPRIAIPIAGRIATEPNSPIEKSIKSTINNERKTVS